MLNICAQCLETGRLLYHDHKCFYDNTQAYINAHSCQLATQARVLETSLSALEYATTRHYAHRNPARIGKPEVASRSGAFLACRFGLLTDMSRHCPIERGLRDIGTRMMLAAMCPPSLAEEKSSCVPVSLPLYSSARMNNTWPIFTVLNMEAWQRPQLVCLHIISSHHRQCFFQDIY
eukprot:scaffold14766_cov45-Prasinocladus_malaysianus.AAC.1